VTATTADLRRLKNVTVSVKLQRQNVTFTLPLMDRSARYPKRTFGARRALGGWERWWNVKTKHMQSDW
jgi:hypothetical protein